jgi:hypothetical protein
VYACDASRICLPVEPNNHAQESVPARPPHLFMASVKLRPSAALCASINWRLEWKMSRRRR